MPRFAFTVQGLPPKKNGANSMWGKKTVERDRLIRLRQAALTSFAGHPPLRANIRLSLTVHVGPFNQPTIGDLDNMVSGFCDGLMAAHP